MESSWNHHGIIIIMEIIMFFFPSFSSSSSFFPLFIYLFPIVLSLPWTQVISQAEEQGRVYVRFWDGRTLRVPVDSLAPCQPEYSDLAVEFIRSREPAAPADA